MLSPQFLAASLLALGLAPGRAHGAVQRPRRADDRCGALDPDGEAIRTLPTTAPQAKSSREPGAK